MADEVLESDIACLDQYDYFFRPDLLSGKVAFITGGGSGIGFTITEVLMMYWLICKIKLVHRSPMLKLIEKESDFVLLETSTSKCSNQGNALWNSFYLHP